MEKILVTGVGGPGGISVAESLKRVTPDIIVVGVDCDPYTSWRMTSDEFILVPPAADEKFLSEILKISNKCKALFCTVDEELPKISSSLEQFNCKVFVPPLRAVELCLDKYKTFKALREAGIPVPNTATYEIVVKGLLTAFNYPLVVKPRRGRGSRYVFKVLNGKELEAVGHVVGDLEMVVQEYVEGPEYTVDVLVNEESELVACVPRERVRVRNGLTMVGRTIKNGRFVELAEKISKSLRLKYIFNFQCRGFEPKVIEVNPRPSGTLILSTMAGVNMPKMLLEGKLKPKSYLNKFKENVWLCRGLNNYMVSDGEGSSYRSSSR